MKFQRISIIGLGYIGLPTAAMFAARRRTVVGVDVSTNVVDTINRGEVHIVEPEIDVVVRAVIEGGYLRATLAPEPADAFVIAVPTPFEGSDHRPDMCKVETACRAVAPHLRPGNLVVLESTSPVGSTERLAGWLAEARPDLTFPQTHGEASDIRIAYCPERVLPGRIVKELVENARIVGGMTTRCSQEATALYRIFVQGDCLVTSARTAEMCKLVENSFRDVNIAFANELSVICDKAGVDAWELIALANRHPRVNILQPGAGVGGHCIAVDPWFLVSQWPEEARLIRTAREVNDAKPGWVLGKVRDLVEAACSGGKAPESLVLAALGIAFKPNIDDLRESPALQIAERLRSEFPGRLLVVEPNVGALPPSLDGAALVDLDHALSQADILVSLVAHDQFAGLRRKIRPGQLLFQAVSNVTEATIVSIGFEPQTTLGAQRGPILVQGPDSNVAPGNRSGFSGGGLESPR